MNDSKLKIRYIIYFFEIMIFFTIQQVSLQPTSSYDFRPITLIPIAIVISFFESEKGAIYWSLLAGALMDYSIGIPLIFNSILLPCLCYCIGFITTNFLQINLINLLLVSFVAVPLVYGFNFLFFYILPGYSSIWFVITHNYIPRMLCTFLVSIFFYLFNKSIAINVRNETI